MPKISMFYGISIYMYVKDHSPPHFHAVYAEHEAQFDIATGKVLKGKLPRTAQRLVRKWNELHRDDLMANWLRRKSGEPLQDVRGLDDE